MPSLYDLTPEEQLELVEFARARLAEEKANAIRAIEVKEGVLDDAEASLIKLRDDPSLPTRHGGWSIAEAWPAYMAHLVAAPYKDHADYKPVWDRG